MSVSFETWTQRLGPVLIPPLRAFVRYGPRGAARRRIWYGTVEPHFAWAPHRFVASTRFGDRFEGDTRDILQQYLYYFGVWEPNLTRLLRESLQPGDVFVDVGANIGYFTLLAARLVRPSGRVVAIEPSPRLHASLQRNLARNRVANVRALDVAVLDEAGRVPLYAGTAHHSGLTTTRPERGLELECSVDALPLSEILEPEEVQAARLIKIDVEGAEAAVVQSLRPLLPRCRDDLEVVVEVDAELLARQGRDPAALFAVFSEAGFHPYRLDNDYSAASYLEGAEGPRPMRLEGPASGVHDIVFSRRDGPQL